MNYPIEGLTELEQHVFTFVTKECFWGEYCSNVKSISEELKLSKSVVKGVIGSLVKKELLTTEYREISTGNCQFMTISDIFPMFGGGALSFANEGDEVSDEGMVLAEKVAKFKFN